MNNNFYGYNNGGYYGQPQYNGYYGQPYNVGYQPQQPPKMPTFNNVLTNEERQLLQNKTDKFTLVPTPLERAKAKCNHCEQNRIMLQQLPNSDYECVVCQEDMRDKNKITNEVLDEAVDIVCDAIQWMKVMNIGGAIPMAAMEEISIALPLISKMKPAWRILNNDFSKIQNPNGLDYNVSYNNNGFAQLDAIVSNPYNPAAFGQPGPQQYYQQPQYMQQQPWPQQQAPQQYYQQPVQGYAQPYQQAAPVQQQVYTGVNNPMDISSAQQPAAQPAPQLAPVTMATQTTTQQPAAQPAPAQTATNTNSTEMVHQHKVFNA